MATIPDHSSVTKCKQCSLPRTFVSYCIIIPLTME
jgi:hypothetical protein